MPVVGSVSGVDGTRRPVHDRPGRGSERWPLTYRACLFLAPRIHFLEEVVALAIARDSPFCDVLGRFAFAFLPARSPEVSLRGRYGNLWPQHDRSIV